MKNAELIKALRCKECFDLCNVESCRSHITNTKSGCKCAIKLMATDAADAKMHEQDLRIADLVAHLNAEQAKVARLVAENERRYMDCRNELCMKCGQYRTAHLGSCDGCRWKEK